MYDVPDKCAIVYFVTLLLLRVCGIQFFTIVHSSKTTFFKHFFSYFIVIFSGCITQSRIGGSKSVHMAWTFYRNINTIFSGPPCRMRSTFTYALQMIILSYSNILLQKFSNMKKSWNNFTVNTYHIDYALNTSLIFAIQPSNNLSHFS